MNSNLVKIHIIEADNSFTKKFDKDDKYVTGTVLMKFEISKLLSQYDKVLYIDGDINGGRGNMDV